MSPSAAMRLGVALAVGLLGERLARAGDPYDAPRPARLTYVVAPRCPEESFFRTATASSLGGIDPFDPKARQGIDVRVSRKGGVYVSRIEVFGDDGKSLGTLDEIKDADCTQVVEAAAFVIIPFVRPLVRLPKPAPAAVAPPPAPKPAEAPECPKPPAPVVTRPEAVPPREPDPGPPPSMRGPPDPLPGLVFRFGAGVWGEQFAAGQGSLGFTVDAGVRYRWGSVAIEARGDPPLASAMVQGGSLTFARATGALLACLHFEWLIGCGIGEAGRILFPVAPEPVPALGYGAVGLRLGLDFPVAPPRLFLRMAAEMLEPIHPNSVMRVGQTVYQTAGTGGGLGVGLLFALDRL